MGGLGPHFLPLSALLILLRVSSEITRPTLFLFPFAACLSLSLPLSVIFVSFSFLLFVIIFIFPSSYSPLSFIFSLQYCDYPFPLLFKLPESIHIFFPSFK